MSRDRILLYPDHPKGEIKAYRVGSFMKNEETFDVIRPGYNSQGQRRPQWTQIVHGGIPIFEHKLDAAALRDVIERFERLWEKDIGQDPAILAPALAACKKSRIARYKDGEAEEAVAPSLTRHGRGEGERYER